MGSNADATHRGYSTRDRSLRTFGSPIAFTIRLIWANGITSRSSETGSKSRAVQLLLGHAKLLSTVRYLGIAVVDALEIAEH